MTAGDAAENPASLILNSSFLVLQFSFLCLLCVLCVSVVSSSYFGRPHTRTVLSCPPDTARRPSRENATHITVPVCPSNLRSSFPEATSHSRTVLSKPPERSR